MSAATSTFDEPLEPALQRAAETDSSPRATADETVPPRDRPSASTAGGPRALGPWRTIGARCLYWLPVWVPLVLFAQVAILGLRPALREAERLAVAEQSLRARLAHDEGLARAVELHGRARLDPMYLERQRRLRELPPEALPQWVPQALPKSLPESPIERP